MVQGPLWIPKSRRMAGGTLFLNIQKLISKFGCNAFKWVNWGFEIAGEDRVFYSSEYAKIVERGKTVFVKNDKVVKSGGGPDMLGELDHRDLKFNTDFITAVSSL